MVGRCILPRFWLNVLRGLRCYMHDLLYYCDVLLRHFLLDGVVLLSTSFCCCDFGVCAAHVSVRRCKGKKPSLVAKQRGFNLQQLVVSKKNVRSKKTQADEVQRL